VKKQIADKEASRKWLKELVSKPPPKSPTAELIRTWHANTQKILEADVKRPDSLAYHRPGQAAHVRMKEEQNTKPHHLKKAQVCFVCKVCKLGFIITNPATAMLLPLSTTCIEKEWTEEMAQNAHEYVDWGCEWINKDKIKNFISRYRKHLTDNWNARDGSKIPAHHSNGIWIGKWMDQFVPKPKSPYD
jgi:hypothetical protein